MTNLSLELHRNLTPQEYNAITSRLNLWNMAALVLTKSAMIGKAKLQKAGQQTDIILIKQGKDARLSYPKGFQKEPSWEGTKAKVEVEMVN